MQMKMKKQKASTQRIEEMFLYLSLHWHLLPTVNWKRKYKHKAKNTGSFGSMPPQDGDISKEKLVQRENISCTLR